VRNQAGFAFRGKGPIRSVLVREGQYLAVAQPDETVLGRVMRLVPAIRCSTAAHDGEGLNREAERVTAAHNASKRLSHLS
jgi:hypothetical protein